MHWIMVCVSHTRACGRDGPVRVLTRSARSLSLCPFSLALPMHVLGIGGLQDFRGAQLYLGRDASI